MSLNIVITGLCAFVRLGPTRVRVVLGNFSNPSDIHGKAIVPGHAAVIHFRKDPRIMPVKVQKRMARPQRFMTLNRQYPNVVRNYLVLDHELITIEPASGKPPTPVKFEHGRLVEMNRVVKEDEIDDALISDDFDPHPDRVQAWLDVTRGELLPPSAPLRTLEFRPRLETADPYRGDFVEQVVWKLPRDKYELRSRSFGVRTDPVSQWEIDATGLGELFVYIENSPLEDLIDPDSAKARLQDEELIDHHFHRYYELCALDPASHPLPRRVSAKSGAKRSLGANCPPAVFEK